MPTPLPQAVPCSASRTCQKRGRSQSFARAAALALAAALLITASGCNSRSLGFTEGKSATEERDVTAPDPVPGSGIDIETPVGAVDLASDPSLKEIKIHAKITTHGNTDEEARARLQDVKIKASRRADNVLEIVAEVPSRSDSLTSDSCSLTVSVPDAKGSRIKSGTGSLKSKGISGAADLDTKVGSITVIDQSGSVGANSGSGSIEVKNAGGDVTAKTSVGGIRIDDTAGAVTATSGSGSITISGAKSVKAITSVGGITIDKVGEAVEAKSGTGSIKFTSAPESDPLFNLETNVGSTTVHLGGNSSGSIDAGTSVGSVTIDGRRKPQSVSGGRTSKTIILQDKGPASKIHSGTGSVTVTLD